jgi:hypothetical protein
MTHNPASYQDPSASSSKGCHQTVDSLPSPLPNKLTKQPCHDAPPNRLMEGISTLGNNLLAGVIQTLRGHQPI